MSNRDDYVATMKQQSDELKAEIDTLETKAQEAKEDAKTKHQDSNQQLRTKYQKGETRLEAIKAAAEDSWENLKEGSSIPGKR